MVLVSAEMMRRLIRNFFAGWFCGVHPYGYVLGILVLRYWPEAEAVADAVQEDADLEVDSPV